MLYLFLGEEQFLKRQELERLKVEEFGRSPSNLNFEEFQAGEDDLNKIIDYAKTAPFMAKRRLAVINEVNRLNSQEKEQLSSFILNKPASAIVVLTSNALSPDEQIYKAAVRTGKVMRFDSLPTAALYKWISEKAAHFGKRASPAAIKTLIDNIGNNLTQLDLTIETIITFIGQRDVIEIGDVERLTARGLEVTSYQFVDAIGSKNAPQALQILHDIDRDPKSISGLIGFIGWHLRRLWRAKKMSAARLPLPAVAASVGVPQYARADFFRQVNNFSVQELERDFKILLKLDKDIKSAAIQPYRALEISVMQLCGSV